MLRIRAVVWRSMLSGELGKSGEIRGFGWFGVVDLVAVRAFFLVGLGFYRLFQA